MVGVTVVSDAIPTPSSDQLPAVSKLDTWPEYERNANGQTYGNGVQEGELGYPPDLLLAVGHK